MTFQVKDITALFEAVEQIDSIDNFSIYKSSVSFSKPSSFADKGVKLKEISEYFYSNGVEVRISVKFESLDAIYCTLINNENVSTFLTELDSKLDHVDDDEKCILEIEIIKDIESQKFNIFCLSSFFSYVGKTKLLKRLTDIDGLIRSGTNKILVWDEVEGFSTDFFEVVSKYFSSIEVDVSSSDLIRSRRDGVVERRDKCSHFSNAAALIFVPYDFLVIKGSPDESFRDYFQGLFNISLIVFLSDFSHIEDDSLQYRIKGYKLISGKIEFSTILGFDFSELKAIFLWVYLDGNVFDRMGLARNIISIHLESDSITCIEKGTSDSVMSGYDLYLKENVKQYIEIKNKISEFLQTQSDKATQITKGMFSMFKSGIWTFSTFFISVFLLRVVVGGNSRVFSAEVFYVSCLLILISFLYMLLSIWELNSDKKELLNAYDEIPKRYKDLLDDMDLKRILDSEKKKVEIEELINSKRNYYAAFWVLINIILLSFTYFMSANATGITDLEENQAGEPTTLFEIQEIDPILLEESAEESLVPLDSALN